MPRTGGRICPQVSRWGADDSYGRANAPSGILRRISCAIEGRTELRSDAMGTAKELITGWRERAKAATVFSPLEVQDRLFELYGEVPESPALDMVKQWLTLTVERDLCVWEELEAFLGDLDASLPEPASIYPAEQVMATLR